MRKLIILLFLTLLSTTACNTSKSEIDSGLFTGHPCEAPCWQGLTPGLSSIQDVEQFVNTLNPNNWPSKEEITYDSGCKLILLHDTTNNQNVHASLDLSIEEGKLTFIQSFHSNMLSLEQVVNHFGYPEYIKAILAVGPDGDSYILEIYYPSKGVGFKVRPNKNDVGFIKPTMLIDTVQYFATGDLLSYMTDKYSCNLGYDAAITTAQAQIAEFTQPWPGFGKVQVIPSH